MDVKDLYPEIENLDPVALHARYNALSVEIGPDPQAASDAQLHEMVCILGALRRKSAGPPKAESGAKARRAKPEVSLDDL